jgi:putative heme-binding domain-containing protein
MQSAGRPLGKLWEQPPAELKDAVEKARPFFRQAADSARDEKLPAEKRAASARLLGFGPFALAEAPLEELLAPQQPSEVQLAAVRALAAQDSPKVGDILVGSWPAYSPGVRREVVEALFARPDRLGRLLTALEEKKVAPAQIEPVRVEQLRKHPDARLRERTQKVFAGLGTADRRKVVDDYQAALTLKGDHDRGKVMFKKTCSVCHRLEDVGTEVGPDLLSALRNKTPEQLVIDILEPSREVDPRYLNYQVTDKAGRTYTGLIAAETGASVTLRRAERAEDTILRSRIDEITATTKSLMPDGLEAQLSKQDLADVITYLLAAAGGK